MTTILAVEDNEAVREELADILRFEGYEVTEAGNGREGLERIRERTPDLVLCDLMMPEMDGYETLSRLRAEPDWATIPFVCLTARVERADMRKAMEAGADDYVTKPFKAEELIAAVRAGLEKKARVEHESEKRLGDLRERISYALPHELRTPLHVIAGYAELLADPSLAEDPTQIRASADGILRAARRLHRLTENFLLYAQLELLLREPQDVAQTPIPAAQVAEAVAEVARQQAAEVDRDRELLLELDSVAVTIGIRDLRKIVEELVDNAFKFSQPGTPVLVQVRGEAGVMTLSISDSGRGMTPQEIDASEAYVQFKRVIHEQQGMGLGLAIARQLVKLYGGTLSIASEAERRTTVSVRLPAVTPVGSGAVRRTAH